jgi:molecular chaperone IbpA
MTNFNKYAPVSLGLETVFNRLDALYDSAAANYPSYNIVRTGEETQELEIALAGFTREQIEVSTERGVLNVTTNVAGGCPKREYVHKGLAQRTFSRNWQLSDDTVIDGVTFVDGLLVIKLRKEVPEAQKRRVLDIG